MKSYQELFQLHVFLLFSRQIFQRRVLDEAQVRLFSLMIVRIWEVKCSFFSPWYLVVRMWEVKYSYSLLYLMVRIWQVNYSLFLSGT